MDKILRLPAVSAAVGLGRDSIYRLIREGKFPKPIKISERASGWLESDLKKWQDERIEASRSQKQAA